jgi:uncharacterized protein (DUF1015 family)
VPRVFPFEGLVYDPAVAGPLDRLTAPPYDVISDPRRRSYLGASAHNIVHVDLAEGSNDPDDPGSRYANAAAALSRWLAEGALVRDEEPSYRVYEMRYELDGRPVRTRGLVCALELEPWGGAVLPHEHTMAGPVQDRLHLLRATRTHLSAVYGTVAGPCPRLADLIDTATGASPDVAVRDEEGVVHRMWRVTDAGEIGAWLAGERLLIADGHHRYTTATAYRDERHATDGPGPWDRILTLIVDAGTEEVPVLPYHRVQLEGRLPAEGEPVADLPQLLGRLEDERLRYGTARHEGAAIRYAVHELDAEPPTVRALHEQFLDRAAPGDALRFTHDADDADAMVRRDGTVAAYFLPPTTPDRILAVVERGERLPRKSTFFWPKPRTGMVLMPLA